MTNFILGGSISLSSASVFDHPLINPALLSTDFDILTSIEAVKSLKYFLTATPWQGYLAEPFADSVNTTTDAEIESYIRKIATTIRHPVGSAALSKVGSKDGVVNPDLTVKGTTGLRVVDASVIVSNLNHCNIAVLTGCIIASLMHLVHIPKQPYMQLPNVLLILSKQSMD